MMILQHGISASKIKKKPVISIWRATGLSRDSTFPRLEVILKRNFAVGTELVAVSLFVLPKTSGATIPTLFVHGIVQENLDYQLFKK
jgi:hypothetical protein